MKDAETTVREQAAREKEAQELDRKYVGLEAAALKQFGSRWHESKRHLSMLDDGAQIPIGILQVALETEDPARVLFELGKDLELADQLLEMNPLNRAIAMDRIASSKPAERPASKAPAPIEPLGGRGGGSNAPSDRDSDEEWNRKEEARERRVAEERRGGLR